VLNQEFEPIPEELPQVGELMGHNPGTGVPDVQYSDFPFKVGQDVRVISDSAYNGRYQGMTGTVTAVTALISPTQKGMGRVKLENGITHPFYGVDLELAEQPTCDICGQSLGAFHGWANGKVCCRDCFAKDIPPMIGNTVPPCPL
jgi:hypothetical protein